MRPRISSFGKITRKELDDYLFNNYVLGLTVKETENVLIYKYVIMFRKNKEQPEELFIEVSKTSKLVNKAYTNKGIKFKNINELKSYTKISL